MQIEEAGILENIGFDFEEEYVIQDQQKEFYFPHLSSLIIKV